MAVVPEGARRSEDGFYWWDGADWQSVPEDERTPGAGDDAAAASGDVTADELAQVTDPEQITERTAPFFQPDPDMYADDDSQAETHDLLTDEPAHDAEGTA